MKALIAIPTAPVLDYGIHEKLWRPTDWDRANRKWEPPQGRVNGDNSPRDQAVRDTWFKHIPEPIVGKFFVGKTGHASEDTIQLDCGDKYVFDLMDKIQQMCKWALDNGFDKLFKCDDDTFCRRELFEYLSGDTPECASMLWGATALSGGPGYLLGRRAMEAVVDTPLTAHPHTNNLEDHWVGESVRAHGIMPTHCGLFLEEPNVAGFLEHWFTFHPVSPNGMRAMYMEYYQNAGH